MNKFGKIWGFTSNIFINDAFSIDRIEINAEQSCSKHYHQYKYNMFFVEKGSILVHRWENNIQTTSRLDAHESITIEPNIYHQFYALVSHDIHLVEIESLGNVHERPSRELFYSK
jgi:mannose-6-phosphate isomerase-like protein (cupin superfamily)